MTDRKARAAGVGGEVLCYVAQPHAEFTQCPALEKCRSPSRKAWMWRSVLSQISVKGLRYAVAGSKLVACQSERRQADVHAANETAEADAMSAPCAPWWPTWSAA